MIVYYSIFFVINEFILDGELSPLTYCIMSDIYLYMCVYIFNTVIFYPSCIGKDLNRHWLLSIPFVNYLNNNILNCNILFNQSFNLKTLFVFKLTHIALS